MRSLREELQILGPASSAPRVRLLRLASGATLTPMRGTPEARNVAVDATHNLPRFSSWSAAGRILAGRNPLTEIDVRSLAARGVRYLLDLREPR